MVTWLGRSVRLLVQWVGRGKSRHCEDRWGVGHCRLYTRAPAMEEARGSALAHA